MRSGQAGFEIDREYINPDSFSFSTFLRRCNTLQWAFVRLMVKKAWPEGQNRNLMDTEFNLLNNYYFPNIYMYVYKELQEKSIQEYRKAVF